MRSNRGKKRAPRVKDQLLELDVRPRKSRGQNFLIDGSVLDAIVDFGAPREEEDIVEIGPGLGALTERLSAYSRLTVIEVEERFAEKLRLSFPRVTVINEDVRGIDFSEIGDRVTVFGNLPYSLSTEIVGLLISQARHIKRAVLLLQREFAERVAAPPGGRDYGTLSVARALWADARLGPIIRGDSFHPPTRVESRLLELRFLSEPRVSVADEFWLRRVIEASFSKRRKKLLNSLKGSQIIPHGITAEHLLGVAIDPNRGAETLSLEEFVRLAEVIAALLPK